MPRRNWGYLPEERGLYPKIKVEEQLLFLARLHGIEMAAARKHLDEWTQRFQITPYRNTKVEALSKGNQQKIQFLATILHDPEILIMDEPFSGLDPVNANILKEAFVEMRRRGKTLIFSTHQLEQAEELCEDILIINKGEAVIVGSVREVKRQRRMVGDCPEHRHHAHCHLLLHDHLSSHLPLRHPDVWSKARPGPTDQAGAHAMTDGMEFSLHCFVH